jgi:hypothetical protein
MAENEPRALTAALAGPAFATKGGGAAMHTANRHVERWAPEAGAHRVRSLRSLGFVDRLVSPWIEAAQRSSSLRLFTQYQQSGMQERSNAPQASWVFPRPWYQDELDWMAASREAAAQQAMQAQSAPMLLTTRGTYVAPEQRTNVALPSALYEYVAPSLSVASSAHGPTAMRGDVQDAYSPLVPFQAVQAAQVMANAVAPIAQRMLGPNLRAVLTQMVERSSAPLAGSGANTATRLAGSAPELVTPPAPRLEPVAAPIEQAPRAVEDVSAQRAQIAELQRAARVVAEREVAPQRAEQQRADVARVEAARVEAARVEATRGDAQRAATTADRAVEQARVEARIAERLQERERAQREAQEQITRATADRDVQIRERVQREQRLHDQARDAAARDARTLPEPTAVPPSTPAAIERRMPQELVAAIATLSPELATTVAASIAQRPERAARTIDELHEALRTVELIARNAATGGTLESARGPRLVMPAGLGGLVATVDRNVAETRAPALTFTAPAQPMVVPRPASPAAMPSRYGASLARVPAMPWLAAPQQQQAPASAFAATEAAAPQAIQHVAWADRWLARFAGARGPSLDLLTASAATAPERRFAALASAAPESIFVAPQFNAHFDGATAQLAHERATPAAPAEPPPVRRYDDNEPTPDDELIAISAAATRARIPAPVTVAENRTADRMSFADAVAHAVPAAPHAGLSAQLASSPFAPAFRHVFPLPTAPAFDTRALFGEGLTAAYLAGLLAPATHEVAAGAALGMQLADTMTAYEAPITRSGIEWAPTYVSPSVADLGGGNVEQPTSTSQPAQVTTMRSALLSWDMEAVGADVRTGAPTVTAGPALARTMTDAMALPMLGDRASHEVAGMVDAGATHAHVPTFAAPGMVADRAHAWSVAQERSASDLAFDFVTPELVLAARVYGLGPAEAAQAMRLAIAGPGQLATMASTVDRTFVQALAIEADRRDRAQHTLTAYPTTASPNAGPAANAPTARATAPTATSAPAATFGVDRRQPRGAFMWPSATVAALGLTAAAFDGEQSMSVAALELLAAQSVAALGTYAALGPAEFPADRDRDGASVTPASMSASAAATPGTPTAALPEPNESDVLATATAMVPSARRAKFEAMYVALGQSGAARAWSPAARAARALALAGRGDDTITSHERAQAAWDVLPVVAPIALGLAGDDAEPGSTLSTGTSAQRSAQAQQRRAAGRIDLPEYVESRPGLAGLSARAGEALGSYVAPTVVQQPASERAPSASSREQGAVLRAPTAAQEMVRTGRPAGRFGGGEVEIPTWFEQAARKMFDERSSASTDISLAELTLVNAAPSTQIAASSRGVASAAPANPNPSSQGAQASAAQQVDIEKVANEVYKQILVLMDAARSRNGEPYL